MTGWKDSHLLTIQFTTMYLVIDPIENEVVMVGTLAECCEFAFTPTVTYLIKPKN